MTLRAPAPYYGDKLGAAELIEQLMGPINNLVIPASTAPRSAASPGSGRSSTGLTR